MPFASFRNIQKRYAKLHKERAQPDHRRRLGILPKKQDFIKRARDTEKKNEKMRELRIKALTRNPDEFYFSMKNHEFSEELGHIPLNCSVVPETEEVKPILKMDIEMLKNEIRVESSKINSLRHRFNLQTPDCQRGKHIKFASSEQQLLSMQNEELLALYKELSSSSSPSSESTTQSAGRSRLDAEAQAGYTELRNREKRLALLQTALKRRLAKAALLGNKDELKVVEEGTSEKAPVYHFNKKRKR